VPQQQLKELLLNDSILKCVPPNHSCNKSVVAWALQRAFVGQHIVEAKTVGAERGPDTDTGEPGTGEPGTGAVAAHPAWHRTLLVLFRVLFLILFPFFDKAPKLWHIGGRCVPLKTKKRHLTNAQKKEY